MKEPSAEDDTRALVMSAYEMADKCAKASSTGHYDGLDRAVGRDCDSARLVAAIAAAKPGNDLGAL